MIGDTFTLISNIDLNSDSNMNPKAISKMIALNTELDRKIRSAVADLSLSLGF